MNTQRKRGGKPTSLRARGVELLSQREHSVRELRQKLLRHARLLDEAQAGLRADVDDDRPEDGGRLPPPVNSRCAEGAMNPGSEDPLSPQALASHEAQGAVRHTGHPGTSPPHQDAEEAVDAALAWLQAQGYLSDTRFVQSRVHVRSARFGNLRIRQELAQHHVALTPEAAQELQASELTRAQAVYERKFGGASATTSGEAAKQARFLAQRGFSSDVVRQVLRAAGKAAADE
jgi:regulatory protein